MKCTIIFLILTLLAQSFADPVDPGDFYLSLRSNEEVADFIRMKYYWAGERVVQSENGEEAVMTEAKNSFTFKECLTALTERRAAHQSVVFDIEKPWVLKFIAPHFTRKHNFVILLLRAVLGPNGLVPKFGIPIQVHQLLKAVQLNNAVRLGIGFTSTVYGPMTSFLPIHFVSLQALLQFPAIAQRAYLIEFNVVLISNTDIDMIGEQVTDFPKILFRAENFILDSLVNVETLRMFRRLGTSNDKYLYAISDALRKDILNSGDKLGSGVPRLALCALLIVTLLKNL